jgi:hypothetical protein
MATNKISVDFFGSWPILLLELMPNYSALNNYAWYLDITPNQMFSLGEYPIPGKDGLPLCELHGRQLELKEVILFDQDATKLSPPDHCWVCED